jgi:hypothetical protein
MINTGDTTAHTPRGHCAHPRGCRRHGCLHTLHRLHGHRPHGCQEVARGPCVPRVHPRGQLEGKGHHGGLGVLGELVGTASKGEQGGRLLGGGVGGPGVAGVEGQHLGGGCAGGCGW